MNYIYELEMKVRDYECDLQGIVNNANYQHYLEHTRHEFLTSVGVSFAALHEQGVDPVVARINMAFKTPLKSGDEFVSKLYMKKEGIKYVFYQDIFRKSDNKVVVKSTVETVCVVNGRLSDSELFDNVFVRQRRKSLFVFFNSRISSICAVPAFSEYKIELKTKE